jgi:aminotransferase
MATLDGMRDRTITINGLSKTYSVTGWRVGYAIAPAALTAGIRKVHDFLTVGAAAPLQEAGAAALGLPAEYYRDLASAYQHRRDTLLDGLQQVGLRCSAPRGAYYIMADISGVTGLNDLEFTRYLVQDVGVAVVPGSSFFHRAADGSQYIRFCFCKRESTLLEAALRLRKALQPDPSQSR